MGDRRPFVLRGVNQAVRVGHDRARTAEFYRDGPDGICLELAAGTRTLGPEEVRPAPVGATAAAV